MTICPLVSLKMEQAKEGVVAPGWLSSRKGKFSEGFRRRLGRQLRQGPSWWRQGRGLAGSGTHQVAQQSHAKGLVGTGTPRETGARGSAWEAGKDRIGKPRPGTRGEPRPRAGSQRGHQSLTMKSGSGREARAGQAETFRRRTAGNQATRVRRCCRAF